MYTNGNNGQRDMLEELDYDGLVLPGQGKIEAMRFASDQQIEHAVGEILGAIGETPRAKACSRRPRGWRRCTPNSQRATTSTRRR